MKKFICIILIISLFFLTGCSNNSQNLENEKTLSEAIFLENGLITIYKKYFQDDYKLENGDVNWTTISEDFNLIKNSIDVILIDFSSIQIPSKYILQLENNFNDIENFINAKDLNNFAQKICENYNLISYSILDNISENKEFKLEKKSKSDLVYIGLFINNNNKEKSIEYIKKFQDNYSNLSTSREYIENNSYKINKIYIETQNLSSKIEKEDFENAKENLLKILEFF